MARQRLQPLGAEGGQQKERPHGPESTPGPPASSARKAATSASISPGDSSTRKCPPGTGRPRTFNRPRAPLPQHVEARPDARVGAPEGEERARDAPVEVGLVVPQVDRRGGPVVGAGRRDHLRVAETAPVLLERPRGERGETALTGPAAEELVEPVIGVGADHRLGQSVRLDEEEPVEVAGGDGLPGLPEHRERGDDVDHAQPGDAIGMVEREPVADPPAPVVPHHREPLVAERGHHGEDVRAGRPLRIGDVSGAGGRPRALAVAPQVRRHDGVAAGQLGGHQVPHGVGLRVPVQQDDGWAVPPCATRSVAPSPSIIEARNPGTRVAAVIRRGRGFGRGG